MTSLTPIQLSADDGVDRKQLMLLRKRFLHLNRERLEQLRDAARDRERLLVDVLPLLFHVNHPALPGWVSADAPAAIADYTPTQLALATAKKMARTFDYERRASLKRPILALYLMGSTGTIAQSSDSDLDLWVILADDLSAPAQQLLQHKIQRITQFARELDCRLHCFPMTAQAFRSRQHGSLSAEHAGSTQHMLLLDEFYRTAINLAGRLPLWWMVPPDQHEHYDAFTELLLRKRFIRANDFIDFGNVSAIPIDEFFSGAVWHLYKAIDSPYKSVLKLMLMEAYASAEPTLQALSLQFKQMVYQGQVDREHCDPYLMVLNTVESYLRRNGSLQRLQLLRRSFYLKVGERLSSNSDDDWRRRLLRERVREWGWSAAEIADLDNRRFWKIARTLQERRVLVAELTHSYRTLFSYARERSELDNTNRDELTVLGRKLYSAFEKRAGKIEQINPGIAPDLSEPALTISLSDDGQRYGLYTGAWKSDDVAQQHPLRYAHDPLELIVWSQLNGLLTRKTALHLAQASEGWRQHEVQALVRAVQQLLASPLPPVSHDDLAQHSQLKRAAIVLNMGVDPFAERSKLGLHLVSSRTDPLAYGAQRENLLRNVGIVRLNSWGEVDVHVFHDNNALVDALALLLKACSEQALVPAIEVHCFSPTRADNLVKRVSEIVDRVMGAIRRQARATPQQFLLRHGFAYWLLHLESGAVRVDHFADFASLLQMFAEPLPAAVERHFDVNAFDDAPLPLIYLQRRQGAVQVFFRLELDRVDVWVLDESDALVVAQQAFSDWNSLLRHWYLFLTRIGERLDTLLGGQRHTPEFYELSSTRNDQSTQLRRIPFTMDTQAQRYFSVEASAHLDEHGLREVTLTCGAQEFSELEHGKLLYQHAAKTVFKQRSSAERYPIYIADLVISSDHDIAHCAPYVRYKLWMEEQLNN